ncbi:MAG: cytochrome c [Deltaproteobacteria bacterium]|nr:cytochrome c [Deltaproteobacteria bacterium]
MRNPAGYGFSTFVVVVLVAAGCSGAVRIPEEGLDDSGGGAGKAGAGGVDKPGNVGSTTGSVTYGPMPGDGDAGPTIVGMLDCPTVAAPGYGVGLPDGVKLSAVYKSTCSTCHGGYGEGQGKYPPLPGKLDEATYISRVRMGGHGMPAFAASVLPDSELRADFGTLSRRPESIKPGSGALAAEVDWDNAQVEEAYQKGLAMWRMPDPKGMACANCHSPDAIDLAVIAYRDDAILRRATLHLTSEQALVVRDLVHAQRKRFNITRPCTTDWRPFQPGGQPLPGTTRAEQDHSFLQNLVASKSLLMTSKVDSLARAQAVRDELSTLDLRKTKLGIHFARWTEDAFNGEEHRSINDWIPQLPRVPHAAQKDAWYKLMDAYTANPTNTTLYALLNAVDKMTNDGGYDDWFEANGKLGHGNWLTSIMQGKYESVLLAQHFFRMALMKKPGWFELGPVPFEDHKSGYMNPWWNTGNTTIGPPCANDPPCQEGYATQFPEDVRAELPQGKRDATEEFAGDFSHNWFTIGELLDQGLLNSGGAGHNTTEAVYWNGLKIGEHRALQTLFNAQRVMVQTQAKTSLGDFGHAPLWRGDGKAPPISLLLHGQWFKVALADVPEDTKDLRIPAMVRMNGNIMRTFLLLMQDKLKAAGAVADRPELLRALETWQGKLEGLVKQGPLYAKAFPELAGDMDFFSTDIVPLLDDVTKRVAAAKETEAAGP